MNGVRMSYRLVALSLIAGTTSALVLTPSLRPAHGGRTVPFQVTVTPRGRVSGTPAMGIVDSVIGPIKELFNKPAPNAPARTRSEGAELYRTLGVSPDADYSDVTEACERLKEKYASDRKKVVQLDKAKDDIMALRLKQAVSGTMKTTEDAQYVDAIIRRKDAEAEWRRKQIRLPKWAKGVIMVPDQVHASNCFWRHGLMGVFSAFVPSTVMVLQALGCMNCMGTMMNRGQPELIRDENNQVVELPLPAMSTAFVSLALVCGACILGGAGGNLLSGRFGERYIMRESMQGLCTQTAMLFLALFVNTWKDPPEGKKTRGRRR